MAFEKGGGQKEKRLLIMGAAGRDFHNFNMVYRDDPGSRVVAFTASQIPDIAGRCYPGSLAGDRYPDGIPIVEESQLAELCRDNRIDQVVFAYSDIAYTELMHRASIVLAQGADFLLLGPDRTMLHARVPVISVCAVRTGCGKSQTTRYLARLLKAKGLRVAVIRHPMPYGDLETEAVQCFTTLADLDAANCSVEEREEYEPLLRLGNAVYAGVDYASILAQAEHEADIILWDGGNNDFSFIRPDLNIVLVDPLRPGNESSHHPGEAVLRRADLVVIAKVNSAAEADIQAVTENVRRLNPSAPIVRAASPVQLDTPEAVTGKRVLVVEDGPSITHGDMPYGAGYVAASAAQAAEIIDPRLAAEGGIAAIYADYPHIGAVLPAMGYHRPQLQELRAAINAADADIVVVATPCDLAALIKIDKPVVRARYEFEEVGEPGLSEFVEQFIAEKLNG
ncbi:cyclic 2,3-diphosphoglycerate synthase [Marinobacterium sp. D7]|uniref:cyclic 2,3-diphosphoglycerate synthase n=1 Tax=Marinobacterium ramblicola TaxID=2849041 RepID=UPI001C2D617C|nr:cyclic 2,3-diphosphoglycerate synthase [Marinobacterium ramblicola]MBV1788140.1 cyclic 2,3-diphosphoglycerate synthase [Marinobacterium ramblicola]